MAEAVQAQTRTHRPAEDIAEDLASLIRSYPPLFHSRHWFTYEIAEGVVTLRGHIKSPIGYRVLMDNVPDIPGVEAVEADELYSDEDLRLEVARTIPPGVLARIDFGTVVLSGTLPPRRKPEALINKIATIKGVRKVESNLR
jgi:hypothetical protein